MKKILVFLFCAILLIWCSANTEKYSNFEKKTECNELYEEAEQYVESECIVSWESEEFYWYCKLLNMIYDSERDSCVIIHSFYRKFSWGTIVYYYELKDYLTKEEIDRYYCPDNLPECLQQDVVKEVWYE